VPELPDIAVYVDHLARRFVGGPFEGVRLASPFILRTAVPPISDAVGRTLTGIKRLGKRLVFELDRAGATSTGAAEARTFLVIHLMVAGRFRLVAKGAPIPKKLGLASLEFPSASVILTEAGTKRRASIHYVTGPDALAPFDRGGIEPLTASLSEWRAALTRENHTLKRALTDPRIVSGVGNGYSDEILHVARLSPLKLTNKLDDDEWRRLHEATRSVLEEWIARLTEESKDGFPENVTAFREEMRVHGKYKKPCPVCGSLVLRIVYADNETNYCAACQTDGRPLADRSMSRLLGKDWPRSLDELEELRPTLLGKPNPARSTKPVKPKRVKADP
jgi:formamidopyrimidine-DNA glycosylase